MGRLRERCGPLPAEGSPKSKVRIYPQGAPLGEGELRVYIRQEIIHSEILYLVDSIMNIKEHREELVHVR